MIALLLIVIPLVTGLLAFFFRGEKSARSLALLSAIGTLTVSVLGLTVLKAPSNLSFSASWMSIIGSSFTIGLDGMGQLLCLLNAIAYVVILVSTWNSSYRSPNNFFGLLLLAQAGMMGVFLAMDALLFYFSWELALIPVYFLCSQWGGEKRIQVTFKFFVYTFLGSLLMLTGILYIYSHTQSFAMEAFYNSNLSGREQSWVFWLFFIAFAVKMPVFPFHTWQPDTYEQSPTAVTMVLSGIMVKMGVFGVLRWLLPVLPVASYSWGDLVSTLSVTGMLYASLIAMKQDDIKRLVAYSSIAHVGLMCLAIFSESQMSVQGVMIQMFNHGINIIGLWIVVELIERQFRTRKMSELGGLATKAPAMAILFVVIAFANIALPLTNAFIGEFLMFSGIFNSQVTQYNVILAVLAGVCIILAAVYTLNMIRRIFFGESQLLTVKAVDLRLNEKLALGILVALIIWGGVYPQPMLDLTTGITDAILNKSDVMHLIKK